MRIQAIYQQVDAEGQRLLQQCRDSYDQANYTAAMGGYRAIIRTFPRRPFADEARTALAEAIRDPGRKKALDQVKAQEMDDVIARMIDHAETCDVESCPVLAAPAKYCMGEPVKPSETPRADRIKALQASEQVRIVEQLQRLAKIYPAFAEGQSAAADIKTLEADEKFQAAVKRVRGEQEAKSLMDLVNAYRKIGKNDKAAEYCKQLVTKHPDTELAVVAQDILDEIELE